MTTNFQLRVWRALAEIPRGRVTTYGEIARHLGAPRAARAVGSACGANPHLVKVPCHRVVNADGTVGQYAGGAKTKVDLLRKEGVKIHAGKVANFDAQFFTYG